MSSDTSVVTVLAKNGSTIELRVRTTTAGGLDDWSCTRSFALVLLADARRRAADWGFAPPSSPTPLELERDRWEVVDPDWYVSETFMREHVARYVASVDVLARANVRGAAPEAPVHSAMTRVLMMRLPPREEEDRLCEVMHHVVLRAEVTDPRWLEGLEPGLVFGSTAFDVWWDDPTRAAMPDGTKVPMPEPAWRVHSLGDEYWMIRHDGASHIIHEGKIGSAGRETTTTFPSVAEAAADVARRIEEKIAQGYASALDDAG